MARHRSHSIEFKRQVAQEFIAGETLYALSRRHDLSRQLIRVWVQKYVRCPPVASTSQALTDVSFVATPVSFNSITSSARLSSELTDRVPWRPSVLRSALPWSAIAAGIILLPTKDNVRPIDSVDSTVAGGWKLRRRRRRR